MDGRRTHQYNRRVACNQKPPGLDDVSEKYITNEEDDII